MKALHYTTASIFSADYRCYGSLAADDRHWRSTACAAADLISQASPSRLPARDGLGCLDPQLGGRVQLKVLIERSADRRQWCLAATAAGMGSASRADFTGRRIRDAIHITACGAFEDEAALQEAIQAVRGIWRLAHDPSLSLDAWCCQEAFEQDRIPFPPAADLWAHLVNAGARPLVQPGAAGRQSVEVRQPRPLQGADWGEPPRRREENRNAPPRARGDGWNVPRPHGESCHEPWHAPEDAWRKKPDPPGRSRYARCLPGLLQEPWARLMKALAQTQPFSASSWLSWWPFQPGWQGPARPRPAEQDQGLLASSSDDHGPAVPTLELVLRQLQEGCLREQRVLL